MLCKLLVFTQAILFVSGCTAFQGYPERPSDLESDLSELEPYVSAGKIKTCLGIIEPPTEGRDGGTTSQTGPRPLFSGNAGATTSVDDATARACRDQLVAARMYATDLRFSQFEERLFRQTRESGFAATLATLGLTTSAAFVGGGTSQVMSGIAAFIIGGREAFEKDVLAERTLVAIHTAMRAGRAGVGVRLRSGLRQSINDYPLAVALSDLNDYYDAGTILGALVGITESVGTQARQESQRLENVTLTGDPNKASPSIPEPPPSGDARIERRSQGLASTVQGAETQWEKALVASQVESIQRYLCAAQIDGKIGTETRDLIRIWQEASRFVPVTGKIDTQRQGDQLLDDALSSPCDRNVYLNPYERLNFATTEQVEALRARLATLNLGLTLPDAITSPDQLALLRDAIAAAGRRLDVDTSRGITRDFRLKLISGG